MNTPQKVTLVLTLLACCFCCALPPSIEEWSDFSDPGAPVAIRRHSGLTCPFDRDKGRSSHDGKTYSLHVVDLGSLAARVGAILSAGLAVCLAMGIPRRGAVSDRRTLPPTSTPGSGPSSSARSSAGFAPR